MISSIHVAIALLAALWFYGRARAVGKDPNRWAVYGGGAYLVPASVLTGLLLGLWRRSVLQAVVPLEAHFFTTGQVFAPLFLVLLPSALLGLIVTLHVFCGALAGTAARRMNERTYVFEGTAVLLALVGWLAAVGLSGAGGSRGFVGQPVFPDFTDPTSVVSLEIVRPVRDDKGSVNVVTFQVAKDQQGVWSIPSHEGYPADAERQLAEAAGSLKGLNILDVASEDAQYHAQYEVVEPTEDNTGAAGVGTKVTLMDRDEKTHSVIVGKEVPEQFGQRYVRVADQGAVLVVNLSAHVFSTDFGDWIEKDLLKMSTEDVKSITMADYSVERTRVKVVQGNQILVGERPDPVRRGRVTVEATGAPRSTDPDKPEQARWKLTEDKVDKDGKWVDGALAPDEELNARIIDAKINALNDAMGQLKIVNVARKEDVLANFLRTTGKFPATLEANPAVRRYGFDLVPVTPKNLEYLQTLVPAKEKTVELLSGQGDLRVATKEGVVYVLRFGSIASTGRGGGPAKKEAAKEPGGSQDGREAKPEGDKVNRYLFIMAEFDRDLVPVPQSKKGAEPPKPGEPAKSDSAKAEPGKAPEPPTPEATKKDDAAKKPAAPKPDDAKKPEPAKKPDPEAERKELEAKRKEAEESLKKWADYDQKIKDGEKRAQELNERFADWFYVISDSEYQKIHLSRKDLITKKEPKKEGTKEGTGKPALGPSPILPPLPSPEPKKEPPPVAKTQPPPKPAEPPPAPPKKPEPPAPKTETPAPPPKPLEPPAVKKG